jgi:hypothetical protein
MLETVALNYIAHWIDTEYNRDEDRVTLWVPKSCVHQGVLDEFDTALELADGYHFVGTKSAACPVAPPISGYSIEGDLTYRTGAYIYDFECAASGEKIEMLVVGIYAHDGGNMTVLASLPRASVPLWVGFSNECQRIQRLLKPEQKVIIIGGSNDSFVPTVEWDDIILPSELKSDFLRDVETFFSNGVEIYQQLKLKPFRKLLLAGVPGTGKTMLCNALAKWALERDYLVVYISSTDPEGASFRKIERALQEAAESKYPTLMILEEVDAYLHSRQKAMVLNVLDGSESAINERGTLLVATTNYPEAIDERVLKRPGRLDRVFIVPETQTESEAEKMLQWYLGEKWLEEHSEVAWDLVGYPGAFIREVAIHALTQVAFDGSPNLSADTLRESFENLREYIDKRDAFLAKAAHRKQPVVGFMEKL